MSSPREDRAPDLGAGPPLRDRRHRLAAAVTLPPLWTPAEPPPQPSRISTG